MSGFIEEFYYGNIEPQACNSELNKELKKLLSTLTEKEELLTSTLNGEEKDLFAEYVNSYNEFLAFSIADGFISGFRLGARFTYDTFVESEN